MFPLASELVLPLSFALTTVFVAMSIMSSFRSRPWLLMAGLLPPVALVAFMFRGEVSLADQYAFIPFIVAFVLIVAAFVFGSILGALGRHIGRRRGLWTLAALAILGMSFELWRQYVPSDCLERPLPLLVTGQRVDVPPILRPRLEWEDERVLFNWDEEKYHTARVCRLTRNATRPLDVDVLWVVPSARYRNIAEFCETEPEASICSHFDADAWSGVQEAKVEPVLRRNFPFEMYRQSERRWSIGDEEEGAMCLTAREPNDMVQCYLWQPFGKDGRLMVLTQNFAQDRFRGASVEDVLPFVEQVRDDLIGMLMVKDIEPR